jgi:hypothetical protein
VRRFLIVLILAISFGVVALPAGASTPSTVSPPPKLPADCSKDVAHGMQRWLASLPPDTTVVAPPGACYLIDTGLIVRAAQGLTIDGGIWEDETVPVTGASPEEMEAAWWFQGGSNITLENLTITGSSPGGYVPAGAFGGGIRSDGVIGLTVTGVNVDNVWGDGLELAPLRASNDNSSVILNPSENVFVSGLRVNGAGRQGVSLASVSGADLTGVRLNRVGIDFFDVEADQWDEGARNVTINGCRTGGVGELFFANAGMSSYTSNITVENCTMEQSTAGDAVLVEGTAQEQNPRGPFTFLNDTLRCGSSIYVACIQSTDAKITVANSQVLVPGGTVHEAVFDATKSTGLNFAGDSVSGYGTPGTTDRSSVVSIAGGTWSPYTPPHSSPGPVHAGNGSTTAGGSTLGGDVVAPTSSTTSSTSTTSTTNPAGSRGFGGGQSGTGSAGGGPGTATVLTSGSNDPLASPLARAIIALDLGAGAVAYGLILVRRRRHLGVVPAAHSVQDLLGRQRRSGSA